MSNWTTVGLYGFRSAARFAQYYEDAYDRGRIQLVQGARYVAPIYELMLIHGERVVVPRLQMDDVHILGTPRFSPLIPPRSRLRQPDVVRSCGACLVGPS